MARDVYRRIIKFVLKAAELARSIGMSNLLQPGLVKEMYASNQTKCKVIYELEPEYCGGRNGASTGQEQERNLSPWILCGLGSEKWKNRV